ncbi:MAG: tRNA (5-methylaminomethyl-2-thiouridine)(34)-methyltransferase MnmD [Flavobacteriaceae bacterium]
MKRKIIITDDGSTSFELLNVKEQYHSTFGAIQEAQFVYIKNGLNHVFKSLQKNKNLAVLEMGFGTGLNAFLSFLYAKKNNIKIDYTGIEAFPLNADEVSQLNYIKQLKAEKYSEVFKYFHTINQDGESKIDSNFSLKLIFKSLNNCQLKTQFNLIYFDAFGPDIQSELWTEEIFKKMYSALLPQGVLVTYSAKGQVRRNMIKAGFEVERLEGPPGKREMLRATKVNR